MSSPQSWIPVGLLNEATTDFSKYGRDIGLYRALLDQQLVYIGKATELHNGGFRKRLRDYTRASGSARNFAAGQLMHLHKDALHIELLIFERSPNSIPRIASEEARLILELKPIWNTQA